MKWELFLITLTKEKRETEEVFRKVMFLQI